VFSFIVQEEQIAEIVVAMTQELSQHKQAIVKVASYNVGKENLLIGM